VRSLDGLTSEEAMPALEKELATYQENRKRPTNTDPPPDFDGFTLAARSIARISGSIPF
jgi:hypothetical protein